MLTMFTFIKRFMANIEKIILMKDLLIKKALDCKIFRQVAKPFHRPALRTIAVRYLFSGTYIQDAQ